MRGIPVFDTPKLAMKMEVRCANRTKLNKRECEGMQGKDNTGKGRRNQRANSQEKVSSKWNEREGEKGIIYQSDYLPTRTKYG